jgi:chromosome segregation ATPase
MQRTVYSLAVELQDKYKQSLELVASLSAQVRAAKLDKDELVAQQAQTQLRCEQAEHKVAQLDSERQLLQSELIRKRTEIKDLQEQLTESQNRADIAEAHNQHLQHQQEAQQQISEAMEVAHAPATTTAAATASATIDMESIAAARRHEQSALRQLQSTLTNLQLLFGMTNTAISDTNLQVNLLLQSARATTAPPATTPDGISSTSTPMQPHDGEQT